MREADHPKVPFKLSDLQVLLAVAAAGSMNKAARVLNRSQPAVSRAISDLEKSLGAQLLDRAATGVELTASGKLLVQGGLCAFTELDQAVQDIRGANNSKSGRVRIGCSPFLASTFVTAIVQSLQRSNPDVSIDIKSEPIEVASQRLINREIDFLISRTMLAAPDQRLRFEKLFDDKLVVVIGEPHRLSKAAKVLRVSDLREEPWVLAHPLTIFWVLRS